jgi:hypothetical protein
MRFKEQNTDFQGEWPCKRYRKKEWTFPLGFCGVLLGEMKVRKRRGKTTHIHTYTHLHVAHYTPTLHVPVTG